MTMTLSKIISDLKSEIQSLGCRKQDVYVSLLSISDGCFWNYEKNKSEILPKLNVNVAYSTDDNPTKCEWIEIVINDATMATREFLDKVSSSIFKEYNKGRNRQVIKFDEDGAMCSVHLTDDTECTVFIEDEEIAEIIVITAPFFPHHDPCTEKNNDNDIYSRIIDTSTAENIISNYPGIVQVVDERTPILKM